MSSVKTETMANGKCFIQKSRSSDSARANGVCHLQSKMQVSNGHLDMLEPIAVIGLAINFPQNVTTLDSLWNMLAQKTSAMAEFPKERINLEAFYDPDTTKTNTFPLRGAHFVDGDISAFDAPFFSISPTEAAEMDPLQRGLLEVSYKALENAGICLESIAGSNTAVYVGSFADDYKALATKDPEHTARYSCSGVAPNMLANRLSWAFDLTGTSLNIDTACSSSMVALHLACRGLLAHDSSMALVGGCCLIFNPDMIIALNNQNFLSPSSRCFSFDHRADGYARGEGFGMVVLKRLHDALRDGDNIRAVIRGTGSNQDGKTPGITQPSPVAQEQMMRDTYLRAGLDPGVTRYVEAHGTGTLVGDPIEAGAIGAFFGPYRNAVEPLYCGSIKANIGHLEGASGIAGVIKSILMLEKGVIPPNAGFEQVNPNIDADALNLKFPLELTAWPTQGLRRISVNSFGFGGTNAHVILDDAYHYLQLRGLKGNHNTSINSYLNLLNANDGSICNIAHEKDRDIHKSNKSAIFDGVDGASRTRSRPFGEDDLSEHLDAQDISSLSGDLDTENKDDYINGITELITANETLSCQISGLPTLITFSAADEGGLKRILEAYNAYLPAIIAQRQCSEIEYLKRFAYTLNMRRSSLIWKSFATVESMSDARDGGLKISKPVRVKSNPKIAFCFTGQGAQWFAMGRELLHYDVFRESLDDMDQCLHTFGSSWSLLTELGKDKDNSNVSSPDLSQPLCTAIQIAIVDLLQSFELFPVVVVGHSSGEIAAAYCSGALDRHSAMKISFHRGHLTARVARENAEALTMLAVGLSEHEVQGYIDTVVDSFQESGISIGCINSPKSVTITGREDQILSLKALLDDENIFARRLAVNVAYHSAFLQSIADEYVKLLDNLSGRQLQHPVTMVSSVTMKVVSANALDQASYWIGNLLLPVRFSDALAHACNRQHVDSILEIGPHSALQSPIKEIIKSVQNSGAIHYSSALVRFVPATETLFGALGALFCRGHPLNLSNVNSQKYPGRISTLLPDLPAYPFNHSRSYWHESRISRGHRFRKQPRNPFLGTPVPDWNPLHAIWRRKIKVSSESQWLQDHKILGIILYPAAAMLVMAIEAARQMSQSKTDRQISGYHLKDVKFLKSLALSLEPDGVEVEFHLRPSRDSSEKEHTWEEFHLYSCEDDTWTELCRGSIRVEYSQDFTEVDNGRETLERKQSLKQTFLERKAACDVEIDGQTTDAFYSAVMGFGPAFQTLQTGSFNHDGEATADLLLHSWHSTGTERYQRPYTVHPTALDGLFQLPFLAISEGGQKTVPSFIPAHINKLWVSQNGLSEPENITMKACSKSSRQGFRGLQSTVVALDSTISHPMVFMEGLDMIAVSTGGSGSDALAFQQTQCFNLDERPDAELFSQESYNTYRESIIAVIPPPVEMHRARELAINLFILRALEQLASIDRLSLKRHHQQYIMWMEDRKHQLAPNELRHLSVILRDRNHIDRVFEDLEKGSLVGKFIVQVGKNITDILCGGKDALELFFNNDLVKDFYIETRQTANMPCFLLYLDALAHSQPGLRILEIGAGTGSMSRAMLQTLTQYGDHGSQVPRFAHYTYTDISSFFFEGAKEIFKDFEDRVTFKTLDIEKDPVEQGFNAGEYDLIIADNVLHATKNLDESVANARKLVRPGGKMMVFEHTQSESLKINFLFGLLPGWWRVADSYRKSSALVDDKVWDQVFTKAGFSGVDLNIPDHENEECHEASALVTTARSVSLPATIHGVRIIVDTDSIFQREVAAQLQKALLEVKAMSVSIASLQDACSEASDGGLVYIVLLELTRSVLRDINPDVFLELRGLITTAEQIIWVTSGGGRTPVETGYSIINGLARTTRLEDPKIKFVTLALEPGERACAELSKKIVQVYDQMIRSSVDDCEPEYVEREGRLCIDRLVEAGYLREDLVSRMSTQQRQKQSFAGTHALKLSISSPGLLDTLEFVEDKGHSLPLDADEIEIRVHASGVNFRDCLIALGRIPGDGFGFECAGTVHRVGPDCKDFKLGDRVCANAYGTYQTYARCKSDQALPLPDHVSFVEGAALPVTFTTAYYALCHVARIREGESILIHSAAGGTGQAAIQVAQLFNAKIYVTVGSEEKSQLLQKIYHIPKDHIFYSRNGSFAPGIRRITQGRGVEIVLNSLSGDALISSWECMAPFGRFLEIGKKDILENGSLPMLPFARNVSFHAIDLKDCDEFRPGLLHELKDGVVELLFGGKIKPVQPLHVYGIGEVENALRYLQGGKNTGKTVVEMRPNDVVETVLGIKPVCFLDESATYVIAGGLGGIGRSVARWMVQRGAKHLILLSRFGPRNEVAHTLLQELELQGIEVEAPAGDIADRDKLEDILTELAQKMPPIKGCIQSSMVLQDCPFELMPHEKWQAALAPKVQGTQNLHTILPRGMDFFVMLSSITGVLGAPAQGNYSAGCAYQDALARHRVGIGEKATTINLGVMLDDGVLTENLILMGRLTRSGYLIGISRGALYALLDHHCDPTKELSTPLKTQVVVGIDVPASLKANSITIPAFMRRPPFRHLHNMGVSNNTAQGYENDNTKESDKEFISNLSAVTKQEDAAALISDALLVKISKVLAVPLENLDSSTAMHIYGVDSLVAVELRNWIGQTLDADLAMFEILGNTTFDDIGVLVAARSKMVQDVLGKKPQAEE